MGMKTLSIIAFGCVVTIIWINFIDFKLEEWIAGTGARAESLIEVFSRSYLAAFIFYFLNVYIKERREKSEILPFVANRVYFIVLNNHSIINALKADSSLSADYYPTEGEFRTLLKPINPQSKGRFYYQNENWIYLFTNRRESTSESISKILLSGTHIADELRKILLDMDSSLYLQEGYAFNSQEFNDDLAKYSGVFYDYFLLVKKLHRYYESRLSIYGKFKL